MVSYLGDPDEYVDKCPPEGVCTWCGNGDCTCHAEGRRMPVD